jgi:methionine-rich copper-binding protein CopC
VAGHRRRLAASALVAAVAAGLVLGTAAPAQAHDYIVGSTPTTGQTLTALPAEFSVTTNETLVDFVGDGTGFGIRVTDAAGRFYGDGCVSLVDATMASPAALGAAGSYTMVWQLISADAHPVSGTIDFTWAPPAGVEPSSGSVEPPVCGEATEEPTASPTAESSAQPTAESTAAPTATPDDTAATATPTAAPVADDAVSGTTLLWIGGAVLAVLAAIGATLFFVRPKLAE